MKTIEQVNEDFNVKKPKKKALIIAGVIAILVIISVVLIYFLISSKPQFVFNKTIDKLFEIESKDFNSIKFDSKINIALEAEDKSIQTQLAEIEKCDLKVGAQLDFNKQQEMIDLGLEYDDDEVIDIKGYYTDEQMYMYLEGIFDKYIQLDMEKEQEDALKAIFDESNSKEKIYNNKKAVKIIRDELKNQLNEYGEFEKEKVTIEVGDKSKNVTKSTLTLSEKDLCEVFSNTFSNLAENDEFIDYFEESPKDELEAIADKLENTNADNKNKIKLSIYTKGILYNLVAVDLEVIDTSNQTIIISVVKEDEDTYSYKVSAKTSSARVDVIKGEVEIEKEKNTKNEKTGKTIITTEIAETGKAIITIDYSVKLNKGIDKINVANSVNMTEITEKDVQSMAEKLMERPLIGDLLKSQLSDMDSDIITNGTDNLPNTPSINQNSTTTQNEVRDDSYGYSVKYSVPSGFKYEDDYSYDYYKCYELGDENSESEIEATVTLNWDTDSDYKEDIEWDYNYYKNDLNYYKNVVLSAEKTIKFGDKDFKYQILSYESNSEYYDEKYEIVYVWYMLDNEHIFAIELESTDKHVTEDIIKGFLNIDVTKI